MPGRVLRKIKERVRDLQLQKVQQHLLTQTVRGHQPLQHVKEGKIHQPLNHFNRKDVGTFPQRFFVNDEYWQHPDGPVFLFIGGEGPIFKFDVLAGHHVDMAEEHRALLLALEHRFYGDSINPDGLETENLADLSSQQALADLAVFHQFITQTFNLTQRNTWISFGGSYSGSLSAWFRGKIVGLSLTNEAVGGSEKCLAAVREAFSTVEVALIGGNVSQLALDFGCCQVPKDSDDQVSAMDFMSVSILIELMESLADIFMGAVQYNEEGVFMSIKELCGVMTNNGSTYDGEVGAYNRLVELAQIYHSTNQTCEDTTCPFSGMLTLQVDTKLCPMLFGISQHSLAARIAFTNTYYGGDNPHTHRILYVNGGIDPWKELSVVQDWTEEGQEAQIIFIEDTAHCADMMSRRSTDRWSLKEAREEIENHVTTWLKTAAQEMKEKRRV
ncbi:Thymus-specific serine protease [Channa argus]|uniref:Thymus-specific serine protease n=1 Tax=Channa argus TaxID=215402 RepID=A0A6G1PS77_CHAAH|nr:Thymus-specific serine protease [Channa argus]